MHNSALEIRESECLPDKLIRLTQQTGDNEANTEEISLWFCRREIPKKGGKECWSISPETCLANFTPQSHVINGSTSFKFPPKLTIEYESGL